MFLPVRVFLHPRIPRVIPLATSTPGTISWISFDLPLNEYYHFIGFILIFGWARWPMKTVYLWQRLSDWTAHYNVSIFGSRFKAFLANCPRGRCSERNHPWVTEGGVSLFNLSVSCVRLQRLSGTVTSLSTETIANFVTFEPHFKNTSKEYGILL